MDELTGGYWEFQVFQSTDSCGEFWSWDCVEEEEYNEAPHDKRRRIYVIEG